MKLTRADKFRCEYRLTQPVINVWLKNCSNETNLKQEKAEESCTTHVFTKRKSTMVSYQNHRADLVRAAGLEPAHLEGNGT